MTAYSVGVSISGSGNFGRYSYGPENITVAVQAGSYDIRVPQVIVLGPSELVPSLVISLYTGGISGGTALPIGPLRDGSPAATSIAKKNATVSGTQTILYSTRDTTSVTWSPPFDVLINSGHTLFINLTTNVYQTNPYRQDIALYFEELRLSWHY